MSNCTFTWVLIFSTLPTSDQMLSAPLEQEALLTLICLETNCAFSIFFWFFKGLFMSSSQLTESAVKCKMTAFCTYYNYKELRIDVCVDNTDALCLLHFWLRVQELLHVVWSSSASHWGLVSMCVNRNYISSGGFDNTDQYGRNPGSAAEQIRPSCLKDPAVHQSLLHHSGQRDDLSAWRTSDTRCPQTGPEILSEGWWG